MKIALLGDLHGNLPAMLAVERDLTERRVDAVYCLGDLVGKGPSSPETMDWALKRCDVVLQGNWDEAIVQNVFADAAWYRTQLGPERVRALSRLSREYRFVFSGRSIRLVHGRPITPDTVYSDSPLDARRALFATDDHQKPDVVAFADIHRPFLEQINNCGTLLNTGSVGNPLALQPYPSYVIVEGEPGATWGPIAWTFVQLEYDRDEAIRHAEAAAGLPRLDAYINELRTGRYSR